MAEAETYEEWSDYAIQFDKRKGLDKWKSQDESDIYDYKSIRNRLETLRTFREANNNASLLFTLNEGIHGNLGGMGRSSLYRHAKFGTKDLIVEYTNEVAAALEHLAKSRAKGISMPEKLDFFHRANLCYGQTALMLSGAGTYLFFHVGVIKALWEQDLIPDVLSGASGGAIVAAIVGSRKRTDLGEIFDPEFFAYDGQINSILSRLTPGKRASVTDSDLQKIIALLIPDITFAEAYAVSGLKINISIAPAEKHQKSRLLNAVTTPNVMVREAVLASSCIPGIFNPVTLAARNVKGERVPYLPTRKWVDGSLSDDLPMKRLARLYGVNHNIVSQTNPLVLPFISAERGGDGVISTITQTGLETFKQWGLAASHLLQRPLNDASPLSKVINGYISLVSQTYTGDINILPAQRILNPTTALSVRTPEEILDLLNEGERSTWPHIERIRVQTHVSSTLQRLVNKLDKSLWRNALNGGATDVRKPAARLKLVSDKPDDNDTEDSSVKAS
jgi:NTE family protein